ncbi:MAG: hypothetical protein FGM42_08125 [Ilumatobacteraceae bacterium]|nr:hypothetical protein [Ilumatobacteraceae bacterium]
MPASQSLAKAGPCPSVKNVVLPEDDDELARIQLEIFACARHLQITRFGRENKQQCVGFANALMDILRPAMKDRVVGQSRPYSAGNFTNALRLRKLLLARDESTGLPVRPRDLASRPAFVWWDTSEKTDGHVGVYIGAGLFVDSYVAYELAQLTDKEIVSISDPTRWSWTVKPGPQRRVPWPEGHWPRQRVNDGYSVVRVRGG